MFKHSLLALAVSSIAMSAAAQEPTSAELYELIKQQQKQIEALQKKLEATDKKVVITEQDLGAKIEATADAIEQTVAGGAASKTSIGGYGELHLNRMNGVNGKSDKNQIDFHRFVLFFGHQFNKSVRFYSEFELEHALAGDGKPGEVELEQAYIEWDYAGNQSVQAGVFLMPVGILNETHEPDTFYGVERNNVEKNVIPSTWWEGGLNFKGELAEGWSYNAAVHSGLAIDVDGGKYKIRDGRKKVANAPADTFAYTGRVKYTGLPGLELAATLQYQDDLLQGQGSTLLGERALDATLFEAHAVYQVGDFGLRALYAQWELNDMIDAAKAGASEQNGWYVEPSYRINENWGTFARYSTWDNQAADAANSENVEWSIGANYWVAPTAVLKVDLTQQEVAGGKTYEGFNLGVGYSF
ncbi:porin [Simiduia aestuariiviva]|uniref:Putative coiled-coil protein SlyX n=1 Tax=Simiduia aestuariiviva TaxID=1510459 RepID=A0A839UMZ4_9GAMM|nr:porin [Simiduia aestuariiviva]MBB3167920.1 putative coiled-coil protein SlyX [Simiduia aestuariiviva]